MLSIFNNIEILIKKNLKMLNLIGFFNILGRFIINVPIYIML